MPIVSGVNSSIAIERSGRVRRAYGQLLEDVLHQDAALANCVEVTVFTVGIDHAVPVHRSGIHAPFKTVGMVGDAADRPVRIAGATLRVGVLEAPLEVQAGTE